MRLDRSLGRAARAAAVGLFAAALAVAAPAVHAWKPAWELVLAPAGEPGEPFVIEGRVVSVADGAPLSGVHVRVQHADARGRYTEHPGGPIRLTGEFVSGEDGRFRIRTIVPGLAEGSPHLHLQLWDPALTRRAMYTINLCRMQGAGSDSVFERLPFFIELPGDSREGRWAKVDRAEGGGFACHCDIVAPRDYGSPAR